MTRIAFALSILIGLACSGTEAHTTPAAPGARPATTTATCAPDFGIEASPGTRFEDVPVERTSPWPTPGVSFTESIRREGDRVIVAITLANTTAAEAHVDYLTGGAMGYSTNPLDVVIEGDVREATGPEVYPAPRRATLPAHGTITFRVVRCPPFPARIRWTFTPWNGTPEHGALTLR